MSKIIVLDPGHGGTATVGGSSPNNATSFSGVLEKTMTLDMARRIRAALNAQAPDVEVILTRVTDVNVGITARAQVAANHQADLFLSIHFNATHGARGVETWIRGVGRGNINFASDKAFAQKIQSAMVLAIRAHDSATPDRGVKNDDDRPEGIGVLNDVSLGNTNGASHICRACLAEIEFIDHPAVDRLFNTGSNVEAVRNDVASAIAGALLGELGVNFSAVAVLNAAAPLAPAPVITPGGTGSFTLRSPLLAADPALGEIAATDTVLIRPAGKAIRLPGIATIQTALNTLAARFGLPKIELGAENKDAGIFGDKTERAIRVFQEKAKIGVDGRIGDDTLRALDEALSGVAPSGPAASPSANAVALVATPAATLLDQLASAYKAKDLGALFTKLKSKARSEDFDNLKYASFAQWILESGWANSDLARDHFNFGGLKWRDEIEKWKEEEWAKEIGFEVKPVDYTAWDGPGKYCKFASPSAYIDGYWRFIMRDPYKNWEDHASNPKDYISFLLECGYTTSDTYLGEVMNLVPKAVTLLSGASALPSAVPAAAVPEATSSVEAKGRLAGKQIAVVVGHEMAGNGNKYEGGANGERIYNKIVAKHMKEILEAAGAEVFVYEHKTKAYTKRQNEMAAAVKAKLPNCWVTIELHYDDVDDPGPSGHHFQYLKAKELAVAIRDEFEKRFPGKEARRDKGIFMNADKDGSGFLKKAPGASCLVEPFFRSNPAEWAFFANRHREVAEAYCVGIANFAS